MTDKALLEKAAKAAAAQIRYVPETGLMVWMPKPGDDQETRRWNSRYADRPVGCIDERGYVRIVVRLNGRKQAIRGHQLAWYMVHGRLPAQEIDHIDRYRSNNAIANLREVSHSENQKNKMLPKNNTTGYLGVTRSRSKFEAYAVENGKRVSLGVFVDASEAGRVARQFREERGYTSEFVRAAAAIGEQA